MPTIYDNIELKFSEGVKQHLSNAKRVDYCVGYFNIRGWKTVCSQIDELEGMETKENGKSFHRYCRLLVGMTKNPFDTLIDELNPERCSIDNEKASKIKRKLAEDFKKQLEIGVPTDDDENTIKSLIKQLKSGRVVVKLFLEYQLHAKLYLSYTSNSLTNCVALLGSSNFTFSGLQNQGELNVDVLEQDSATKLSKWFDRRWNSRWCIDITKELIEVLENSWARDEDISPYYVYMKMAYHLSQEARSGISEFKLPREFQNELLDFQQKAVLIACQHLNKRNGVLVGDVVGLGKTITACAIAKIMEEDLLLNTLILCPKNLVGMWENYVEKYGLHAHVLSHSMIINELPTLKRYRLVIIDESHNFRNSENKTYKVVKTYIEENESKVILLSATPYNKSYGDLANQLKLFIPEDYDIGVAPERYIEQLGGAVQFHMKHDNTPLHSIRNSGDKYIFDNIKKGIEKDLPEFIQIGVDDSQNGLLEKRKCWVEPAPEEYALPTENWREVVERRKQYHIILDAIESGKVTKIQDFIEYNLDICSFTQDLLDTIDDSAFIRAFYEVLQEMTILDPTCGSGAFLFAALNILEPLYSSCISRMEDFMKYEDALPRNTRQLFIETINSKNLHANKQYFIIKSIILNNLYGVDIMNEAVETTKLRLFLALVATANPEYDEINVGIEPLPDIDFNIKCGNSLVGYSSREEIEKACYSNLFNYSMEKEIIEKLNMFSQKMQEFSGNQKALLVRAFRAVCNKVKAVPKCESG